MAVIAYHLRAVAFWHFGIVAPERESGLVNDVFDAGHLGVSLFFAVSGFILSVPFARHALGTGKSVGLRPYFVRRVTRIEPPYVIHLAFLLVLCALVLRRSPAHPHLYHNAGWVRYMFEHILASLVYANEFVFGTHPYPNGVLWSLEVEVQFYLVAPFLAKIFDIRPVWRRRGFLIGLIIIGTLPDIYFGSAYLVMFSLLGNLQFFLVGLLLADIYLEQAPDGRPKNFQWDLILLFSAGGVVFVNLHRPIVIILPWLILCVCVGAFQGKIGSRFFGNPWITTIGGMCYSIYMYHMILISVLIRGTEKLQTHLVWVDLIMQFLIMAPIIVLVCSGLFVLFERPFMDRNWPAKLRDYFHKPATGR